MAHFAQIDEQGTVVQTIVVNNEDILDESGQESEVIGKQFCTNLLGGEWVQTSYNGNMRKQYAMIGGSYDAVNDVFIAPKPFPSWVLDENFDWQAPVPSPGDDYVWDESAQEWVLIPSEPTPKININSASQSELESLLGIGPVRAQAIVDGRPWASINDLSTIEGISQAMVDSWADLIEAGAVSP